MTKKVLLDWLTNIPIYIWILLDPSKLIPMITKVYFFSASCLTFTFWLLPYLRACFCEYSAMSLCLFLCLHVIDYKNGVASASHAFSFPFSFSSLFYCSILPFLFDDVSYVEAPSSFSSLYSFSIRNNSIWKFPFYRSPNINPTNHGKLSWRSVSSCTSGSSDSLENWKNRL